MMRDRLVPFAYTLALFAVAIATTAFHH